MTSALSEHDRDRVETVVLWCLLLVLTGRAAAGFTDTDVWGHSTIGRWMIDHRAFLWVDPFSFTHDQPWINHEWFWDVVTALVERLAGLPGLVALRALLIGGVLWRVDRAGRSNAFPIRALALVLTTLACIAEWRSLRPQIATLLLYVTVLESLTAWWLPLLFLAWANVHGGWIYGAGLLGIYTLAKPSRRQFTLAAACAVATLVNPYGWHLWQSLFEASRRGWADVSEWTPIWYTSVGATPLLLWVLCVAAIGWLTRVVTLERWQWGWIAVTFAAAASSRRLIALAVVTATLFLLRGASPQRVALTWTTAQRRRAAAALACAAIIGVVLAAPFRSCWPPMQGVLAPEPEAIAFVRSSGLSGRAVVYFDFGLYVVAHLHDRLQVSIDNRRETVYSDAVVQAHHRFTGGGDPDYPNRLGADVVWLPAGFGNVIADLETRGWHRRFTGPRTVLLSRAEGPSTAFAGPSAPPCYPQ